MSADLDSLLAEAKKGPLKPVYLFWGDEFLVRREADALVEALVPGASAGLNWVVMDASSPAEIAQELGTLALFPGRKVVQLRDPELLAPKKGRADGLARARDAWKAGRRKEGARRVLAIAGRAGWGVEQLPPGAPGNPTVNDWEEELSIELAEADLAFLAEVAVLCREERIRPPDGDVTVLLQRLESHLPEGHVLVISASELEPKNPLVAFAKKSGRLIERKVAARLKDLDLHDVATDLLASSGKRLGRGAENALKDRVGGNIRLLQSELEKLALHAQGDVISLEDVELLVGRSRDEEYAELADALQKRDLRAALRYVDTVLENGHPLMLLGAIASIVRGLLEARERLAVLAPRGAPRSFDEFKSRIFPKIEEELAESGGRVPHPYAAFLQMQSASKFRREELIDALKQCAETDFFLKSGSDRLAVERVLWTICGAASAAPSDAAHRLAVTR